MENQIEIYGIRSIIEAIEASKEISKVYLLKTNSSQSSLLRTLIIGCRFDANNTGSVAGIYTINGQDSYGDGWNGASVDFTVDGVTTVITFASGSDVSKTITVPASASSVGIAFTSGDWDSEITYQIEWTDLNGANSQTAISDGTSPSVGFVALNICQ